MIIVEKTKYFKDILIKNNIEFKEYNKENDDDIAEIILKIVSKIEDIPVDIIKYKKTRKREVIHARHLCRKFIKANTLLSLAQVGKFTAGDHAAVLHSIGVVSNFLGTDKPFTNSYNLVLKKIELTFMQSSYSNTQIKLAKILKASDGISKEQIVEMIEDMLISE